MRVIHVLSSVMWSGVERYALDICRHFAAAGCDVLAITRDARAVDDVFRRNSIPVVFAPLGSFLSYGAVKKICEVFAEYSGHTVVHCHDTRDAFAALTARQLIARPDIRVVLTRHYVRRPGRSPFHKFVYRNVDALICVSRIVKDRFLSGRGIVKRGIPYARRVHVIHNSLNIELLPVAPEPEKGPVTAMYLGRLSPGKGLETLIDALSKVTGVKMRLRLVGAGHPDYVDQLRRRAEIAGVMHLIDWPRHKDNAVDFIRSSHFGVLPSSEPEAFGLSNIEYMAQGRPIICTRNGAQPEYIADGKEGILIPPGNSDVLAEKMRCLAESPELRRKIGTAARSKFETKLAWNFFIERLALLYDAGE